MPDTTLMNRQEGESSSSRHWVTAWTRCLCTFVLLHLDLTPCQVEFIIMGGTFMSMPEDYRNTFVAQLHNALSGFTGTDVDEAVRYDGSWHSPTSDLDQCR